MIGSKLRGIRHLARMAESFGEVNFFFTTGSTDINLGTALFVPNKVLPNHYFRGDGKRDWVILFQHSFKNCNVNISDFAGTELCNRVNELYDKFGNTAVVPYPYKPKECGFYIEDIYMLPKDFEKQYESFCEANKKMLEPLFHGLYGNKNSQFAKFVFAVTDGSKNFYQWATHAIFKYNQSLRTIMKMMEWNTVYGKMANKLPKGGITANTGSRERLCDIYNKMRELRRDKRANDVISTFNTAQKKALKERKMSDRDYDTLSRFSKLTFKKRDNFIKKVSSMDDVDEILRQMSFLADIQFVWNKESFKDYLANNENLSFKVILDKDNLMLLKVNDYETIKRLTKATNWCISKDKKYWIEYVEGRSDVDQYVLFDFSCKEDDSLSIVGFSCNKTKGITHSHDFQNRDMMRGHNDGPAAPEMRSFVDGSMICGSIFSLLDKHGIDLSILLPVEKIPYEWSRNGVLGRINECIGDFGYFFLADYDDKFVLMVEDEDIKYFIGDKMIENQARFSNIYQMLLFVDLTKGETDPNRIMFGIVSHDYDRNESNVKCVYNINCNTINKSFDKLIDEWGLPYDIICRNDDVLERFYNAYARYELNTCKDLIKTDIVKHDILSKDRANWINEYLNNSIYTIHSMDYVDMFIENGIKITESIGSIRTYTSLINQMFDYYRTVNSIMRSPIPTKEELENVYDSNPNDPQRRTYVGYYCIFKKLVENEANNRTCHELFNHIIGRGSSNEFYDHIILMLIGKLDSEVGQSTINMIAKYAIGARRKVVVQELLKIGNIEPKLKGQLEWILDDIEKREKGGIVSKKKKAQTISDFMTTTSGMRFNGYDLTPDVIDEMVAIRTNR